MLARNEIEIREKRESKIELRYDYTFIGLN